jgi:hypothetical protein
MSFARTSLLGLLLCACGSVAFALPQAAVEVAFLQGRVTISASDAPVADVLRAWAAAGHTELTGAEYLGTRRITLRLSGAPEETALAAIVGSASWYRAARRDYVAASESILGRIDILPAAASAGASASAATPEQRYEYVSTPLTDDVAAAVAQRSTAPAPPTPQQYPEAVYEYTSPAMSPEVLKMIPGAGAVSQQPANQAGTDAPVPERIYEYTATPDTFERTIPPAQPSSPLTSTEPPERRFAYVTPDRQIYVFPDIQVIDGLGDGPMPGEPVVR